MQYQFNTTVGEGSEIVTVLMEYDTDEDGICDDYIEEVLFEGRNVMGILSAEQFSELEIEGAMRLTKHIMDEEDHAKTIDYDMRNV